MRSWTFSDFLQIIGYAGFDIRAAPCAQMSQAADAEEILSLRYFAPKTSSVDRFGNASELGWRQIVRLRVRAAAPRRNDVGLDAVCILANYQQLIAAAAGDPFTTAPVYLQVMMVFTEPAIRPARWLLFDQSMVITPSIRATFAGGDTAASVGGINLFVPGACGQCHGGDRYRPHLNLFDVDNWTERAQQGDDFEAVPDDRVIAVGSCAANAFDVARHLNRLVFEHNATPALNTPSFVLSGAESWNAKHQSRTYVPRLERSHGSTNWSAGEKELLDLLSRYCYRCHGTILFDVYNR